MELIDKGDNYNYCRLRFIYRYIGNDRLQNLISPGFGFGFGFAYLSIVGFGSVPVFKILVIAVSVSVSVSTSQKPRFRFRFRLAENSRFRFGSVSVFWNIVRNDHAIVGLKPKTYI